MSIAAASVLAGSLLLAEDKPAFNPDIVSPGVTGFIITALMALAVILLGTDLVRRLRRGRYREEIRQSLQAELDERAAAGSPAGDAGTGDAGAETADPPAEPVPGVDAHEIDPGDPPRS